jgi:hypothetical protein
MKKKKKNGKRYYLSPAEAQGRFSASRAARQFECLEKSGRLIDLPRSQICKKAHDEN